MNRIIMKWAIGVVGASLTVWLSKELNLTLYWPNFWWIFLFVPTLAICNASVGSILRLLTLPISCLTLGLFGLIINAIVFYLAGYLTKANMDAQSALFGAICMSVFTGVLNVISGVNKEKKQN